MLCELSIKDIVLIDRLDVQLEAGLTVLTGETGAGKSILLDAFSLALGGRGDGGLVRTGLTQGQVTAVFDVVDAHPARNIARNAELNVDGSLILRRVQMADGRTKAFINDQTVSVQVLKAVGAALVEIHGQHDDRALTDPAMHRSLLDAAGALEADALAVVQAFTHLRVQTKALQALEAKIEKARKDGDYLRHAYAELDKLAPEENEEKTLAERRTTMQQSEKVVGELREAYEIFEGDKAAVPLISSAMRRLERRANQAPHLIEPTVKALDVALIALDEAQTALHEAFRAAEFDPRELEMCEERLFALRAAARKYSVSVDDLPKQAAKFASDLEALDAGEHRLGELETAVNEAQIAFGKAAKVLSAKRHEAAIVLENAVNGELAPLKLERAKFICKITSDVETPSIAGIDQVEFWVQTNPGTKPGPMMKVASGGELSRFMLAIKVVLADRGSAPTLVFDEIDTGVGGAVADAIGQRLKRLSAKTQVLAVTHAPQVAAQAVRHFLIAKDLVEGGAQVATRVGVLGNEQRREEIARMLSGETISVEARAAAERLLLGV
jgi:DNA repair protein RecN (Recombination protein N)